MRDDKKTKAELIRELSELREELRHLRGSKTALSGEEQEEDTYTTIIKSMTDYVYTVYFRNGKAYKTLRRTDPRNLRGCTDEELDADPQLWLKMIPEDDRPLVLKHIEDVHQGKRPAPIEHRVIHRDGSVFWVKSTRIPVLNEEGRLTAYHGILQDITERKHAQETLERDAERLKYALEAANEGLWDHDIETGGVYFSPRHCEILGYEPEEMPQTHAEWSTWVHPDDVAPALEALREHLERNTSCFSWEFRAKTKSGNWKWLLGKGKVVKHGPNGEPLRMVGTNADITERKYAEEALRESEQRLDLALKGADLGLWYADIRRDYVYYDDGYIKMLGYSREEVKPNLEAWMNLVHPEDLPGALKAIEEHKKGLTPNYKIEHRLRTKSGEWKWIQSRGMVFKRDEHGEPMFSAGTHLDIDEQRRAQDELRRYKERLELLVEERTEELKKRLEYEKALESAAASLLKESHGSTPLLDAMDTLRRAVGACRVRLYGFFPNDKGEIYARHTHEVCAEGIERQLDKYPDVVLAGKALKARLESFRAGGPMDGPVENLSDVEAKLSAERGIRSVLILPVFRDDELHGCVGFDDTLKARVWSEDEITLLKTASEMFGAFISRKHHERLLRESEQRYRLLAEHSTDVIARTDDRQMLLYVSPSCERLLGYSPEEFEGKTYLDYLHPEDMERVNSARSAAIDKSAGITEEFRARRKDGEYVWVELSGKILYDEETGKRVGSVTAMRDISERKHAEEERLNLERQMQQAQKLESLGVLAGGVAHDFSNVLSTIICSTSMALKHLPEGSKARNPIELIEKASWRASEFCRQMLAYAGRGKFDMTRVNLNVALVNMSYLLESFAGKSTRIEFDLPDELPDVSADVGQMNQVVMNLVTNASEASTGDENVITISTRHLKHDGGAVEDDATGDALPQGSYICIEVTDRGTGMDEETRLKVFEPFFTTKFDGRGLGLAATLGIVRGHRGTISVKSHPGEGTTMCVYLPALGARPQVVKKAEQVNEKLPSIMGAILVVDDEEDIRGVCSMILSDAGFKVVFAESGEEAISVFRKKRKDIGCVLLDLTMPGISGQETLKGLRKISAKVPVILTSAYTRPEELDGDKADKKTSFLQKPYDREALINEIASILSK